MRAAIIHRGRGATTIRPNILSIEFEERSPVKKTTVPKFRESRPIILTMRFRPHEYRLMWNDWKQRKVWRITFPRFEFKGLITMLKVDIFTKESRIEVLPLSSSWHDLP